jgi:tetratricopeptide (TPR) repeat protein
MVRTAFDRSYARLPAQAAMLFRRLSVVAGPDISGEGAAAIADLPLGRTRELLWHLTSAHLVHEHEEDRYALHDLIRLYAADRATAEADGEKPARLRLVSWYLEGLAGAAKQLYPHMPRLDVSNVDAGGGFADPTAALNWLRAEQANLVACIRDTQGQGLHRLCCVLADSLRGYFYLTREMVDWLTVARCGLLAAQALAGGEKEEAAAELSLGLYSGSLGGYQEADKHYERCFRLSVAASWPEGVAAASGNRGVIKLWSGELPEAASLLREAYESQRALGSLAGQAINLNNLGIVYLTLGRLREAEKHYRQALELHRRAGSRNSEGLVLGNLGEALRVQGRFDEATRVDSDALAIHREVGGKLGEALALGNLATVQRDTGDLSSALDNGIAALDLVRQTGDPNAEANVLNRLASVYHASGQHDTAASLHLAALHATNRTGGREPEIDARIGLTLAYLGLGEVAQALSHGEAALALARGLGSRLTEGYAALALSQVRRRLGSLDAAVELAEAALARHREVGHPLGEQKALALLAELTGERT